MLRIQAVQAAAIAALLVTLSSVPHAEGAPIQLCFNSSLGIVDGVSTDCQESFAEQGINIFDLFWNAWAPVQGRGNISTSLEALRHASALNITAVRTFAAPYSYKDWQWSVLLLCCALLLLAKAGAKKLCFQTRFNVSTRDSYWQTADTVFAVAERVGVKFIPSLGYGCADSTKPCNPSLLHPGETYRDFITNETSQTRLMINSYAVEFVQRYYKLPSVSTTL